VKHTPVRKVCHLGSSALLVILLFLVGNEHVQGKHRTAKHALLAWVVVGKPRQDLDKALRNCREHEDVVKLMVMLAVWHQRIMINSDLWLKKQL
jgi:hypothetical protein